MLWIHNYKQYINAPKATRKIQKGKKVDSTGMKLDSGHVIDDLTEDSTYKYLGIEENSTIEHGAMRKKVGE